ncbi:GEVED domain-containing protein [Streptomyces sp. NBC_00237]|uniref:DUF7927 domain-containing protein n=1 Tax=Streptomyces sp. NBC_00237 TaxID=2975687 RepID=UPI00225A1684|nr:GEVED domain-containing protein [Streptomyces sp. NBC_00237]MCX5200195.1 GEVED domain-containing protein [Streptomyces sp. NBC_00237]
MRSVPQRLAALARAAVCPENVRVPLVLLLVNGMSFGMLSGTVASAEAMRPGSVATAACEGVEGGPRIRFTRSSTPEAPVPGDTVTYTVAAVNEGEAKAEGAAFADNLAKVLDDATLVGEPTATTGTPTYVRPRVYWSGDLKPGEMAVVTYRAKVDVKAEGDGSLTNVFEQTTAGDCKAVERTLKAKDRAAESSPSATPAAPGADAEKGAEEGAGKGAESGAGKGAVRPKESREPSRTAAPDASPSATVRAAKAGTTVRGPFGGARAPSYAYRVKVVTEVGGGDVQDDLRKTVASGAVPGRVTKVVPAPGNTCGLNPAWLSGSSRTVGAGGCVLAYTATVSFDSAKLPADGKPFAKQHVIGGRRAADLVFPAGPRRPAAAPNAATRALRAAADDLCTPSVYVSNGRGPTDLRRFFPGTGKVSDAIPNTSYAGGYDGVGYSSLTGKVYGMQRGNANTLVEIDPSGTVPPKTYTLSKPLEGTGPNYDVGAITPAGDKLITYTSYTRPLYTINLDPAQGPVGQVDSEWNPPNDDTDLPYDFAFHPRDGILYGVGKSGYLMKYDLERKVFSYAARKISPDGVVYLGQFFDAVGNLYAVNDQTPQKIWTLDLTGSTKAAPVDINSVPAVTVPFGTIPAGIRVDDAGGCLRAEDFGDAPDSYTTSTGTDGPAHTWDPGMRLGAKLSVEPDVRLTTDASGTADALDGSSDTFDDAFGADGSMPVGRIGTPYEATLSLGANKAGTLAGWIDVNGNGTFEPGERQTAAVASGATSARLTWNLPADAKKGRTFARFRLYEGTVDDPQPKGTYAGAGEVEDHPLFLGAADEGCNNTVYLSGSETNGGPTKLFTVNPTTGATTPIDLTYQGAPSTQFFNGLGYGSKSGLLVAVQRTPPYRVLTVNPGDGAVKDTSVTLPAPPGEGYVQGAFAADGTTYYASARGTAARIQVVDFSNPSAPVLKPQLATGSGLYDFALHPGDNAFYGSDGSALWRAASPGITAANLGATGVTQSQPGAAFDSIGNLYMVGTEGRFTQTDLTKKSGANYAKGDTVVLSTTKALSENDLAGCILATDFGDAPDAYKTTHASGGPEHAYTEKLTLGAGVSAELDARPSAGGAYDGTGDTLDDGVVLPVLHSTDTEYQVTATTKNDTGADVTLAAWADFNGNGAFEDGERRTATVANGATSASLKWTGLSGLPAGRYTYLRMRLYEGTVADPKPVGAVRGGGEVEDHPLYVLGAADKCDDVKYYSGNSGTSTQLYSVNRADGVRTAIGTAKTPQYDALGYDRADGKLYATAQSKANTMVRIDPANGNVTELPVTGGLPSVGNSAQGAISLDGSRYYARVNNATTLLVVDLSDPDKPRRLPDITTGSSAFYDFDVHPGDGQLYGVGNNDGKIYRINTTTGAMAEAGQISADNRSSYFNGVAFDGGGNLYATGSAYLIKVDLSVMENGLAKYSGDVRLGSVGGLGGGDGAGCLQVIDYGDAPDSYRTKKASGGPSHAMRRGFELGKDSDDEPDAPAAPAPLNGFGDDATERDDEDAVTRMPDLTSTDTSYEVRLPIDNTTNRAGTVAGWVDFNTNGTFDDGERQTANVADTTTGVTLRWTGLSGLKKGATTYARFRLYSGAVADPQPSGAYTRGGEVEDHPLVIRIPADENCTSSVYTSVGNGPTDLYRFDPLSGRATKLDNTTRAQGYDGIGVSSLNGHVYGTAIGADRFTKLVEIDPAGGVTHHDLDPALQSIGTPAYDIGAVSPDGTKLYVHYNSSYPTFIINIDPSAGPVGKRVGQFNVSTGNGLYDWAFHPIDGKLYSIATDGRLVRVDPDTATSARQSSAMLPGAQYRGVFFDSYGNLYGVDNSTPGKVFQVDLTASKPGALIDVNTVTHDKQPMSTVPVQQQITDAGGCLKVADYGDAPDTYDTSAAKGGPTHTSDPKLAIGDKESVESDARPPVGTTVLDGFGDTFDDGVTLPELKSDATSYEVPVKVNNSTGAAATLAGWVDFNANGTFDTGERALATVANGATSVTLKWTGLSGLRAGAATFARFRLYSGAVADPQPAGAFAGAGEVEDWATVIRTDQDICRSTAYLASGANPTKLLRFNPVTGDKTEVPLKSAAGVDYPNGYPGGFDAAALSSLDGMIYALPATAPANGTTLLRIDPATGVVREIPLSSPLPRTPYTAGAVTPDGETLIVFPSVGGSIPFQKINLNPAAGPVGKVLTPVTLQTNVSGIRDWAFHPKDGRLMSVTDNGNSFTVDPDTGAFNYGAGFASSQYVATFFDSEGTFYTIDSKSPQTIWSVDLTDSTKANPVTPWSRTPQKMGTLPAGLNVVDGMGCLQALDFGDAPDSYKTTDGAGGPAHRKASGLTIGAAESLEADARTPHDGTGDTFEDGVTLPDVDVTAKDYTVPVVVKNNTGKKVTLAGWVDWNVNGTFEAGEQAVQNLEPGDTTAQLKWTGVQNTRAMKRLVEMAKAARAGKRAARPTAGASFARFRLYGAEVADPKPVGKYAGSGEVEDHPLTINPPLLQLSKTVDNTAPKPGDTVTYTVSVKNNARTAKNGVVVEDLLAGVLDDATYVSANVVSGGGTVVRDGDKVKWTGDLAAGAEARFAVKVKVTSSGDHKLVNRLLSETDGSNCQTGSGDAACEVQTPLPSLKLKKVKVSGALVPGGRITYKVTAKNEGTAPFPGASVTDNLADVVDDARLNGDQAVTKGPRGTLTAGADFIKWTGDLGAGEDMEFTYSVTVNTRPGGNKRLNNKLLAPASNCDSGSTDPDCSTGGDDATGGLPTFDIAKAVDTAKPTAGQTVTYTVTMKNSGSQPYPNATFTDDLTDVVDDAPGGPKDVAITGGLTAPAYDSATKKLSWTGNLPVGETVVTYRVTLPSPLPATGNKRLKNSLTSSTPGSECPLGTESGCWTDSGGIAELQVRKRGVGEPVPGTPYTYVVTLTNAGTADYPDVELSDDLADLAKDADDLTVLAPAEAKIVGGKLSWKGTVPTAGTVEIRYTATVPTTPKATADGVLENTVVVPNAGSNCTAGQPDADCRTRHAYGAVKVTKTVNKAVAKPGDTVTYTVTLENTGGGAAPAVLTDDLTAVLDAAVWANRVEPAEAVFDAGGKKLSWRGTVPAGTLAAPGKVVVSYDVKVPLAKPAGSDEILTNQVGVAAPGSNCPTARPCTVTTKVARIDLRKQADDDSPKPGDTLTYTVTVGNSGSAPFAGAQIRDSLAGMAGVLSGAPSDLKAVFADGTDAPAPVYDAGSTTLKWDGEVPAGASALVITYKVKLKDPLPAGAKVKNTVVEDSAGSNCRTGSTDADCTVDLGTAALEIEKKVSPAKPLPGDTVTYTVTLKNSGAVTYRGAKMTDDLAGVADDGTFQPGSVTGGATAGTNKVSWAGDVPAGASHVITYKVVLDRITTAGADTRLVNKVTSDSPGANCTDAAPCVTTTEVPRLKIVKKADKASGKPGDVVTYTIEVENTGTADWPDAELVDDVSKVVDDATVGTVPSPGVYDRAGKKITWKGTVAAGDKVSYRYSVTLNQPLTGTDGLDNRVTTAHAGSNCPVASPGAGCTAHVDVQVLEIDKTTDLTGTATAGTKITYTVVVRNPGTAAYTGALLSDELKDALDDATYNNDHKAVDEGGADTGTLTYSGTAGAERLDWAGDVAPGKTVTLTYSVTVKASGGDGDLRNLVVARTEGTNCGAGSGDAGCFVDTNTPKLKIRKSADKTVARPGEKVRYTIEVTNQGRVAYPGAEIKDALGEVLDDAAFAAASLKTTGITPPAAYDPATKTVGWKGDVPGGATFSITYEVTVNEAATGDNRLDNVVVSSADTNCTATSTDPDCGTGRPVNVPRVTLAKKVTPADPAPGTTATYTLTASNTGLADHIGARLHDDLKDILKDADLVAGSVKVDGTAAPLLNAAGDAIDWTGNVPAGGRAEITYEVRIPANRKRGADGTPTGDLTLKNAVTSPDTGTNCPAGGGTLADACTVEYTLDQPQLTMKKTATPKDPQVGERVTYTITMVNTGTVPGADLEITDVLPEGVDVEEATPDAGTSVSDTAVRPVRWQVAAIGEGDTKKLVIIGRVTQAAAGKALKNTATVTAGPDPVVDPVSECLDAQGKPVPGKICDDGDGTPPGEPKLTLTKTQSPEQPQIGSTVTYAVQVVNSGADEAKRVALDDMLPAGLTLVSATASLGTVDRSAAPVLHWNVGTVPASGGKATLTVVAKVNQNASGTAKLINQTWETTGPRPAIPDANKCTTDATRACSGENARPPAAPELTMEKRAVPTDPQLGEEVTYTVTLRNTGDVEAKDLEYADAVPAGVRILSVTADALGTATDARPSVWKVPSLKKDETATLVIRGKVTDAAAPVKNRVKVIEGPNPTVPPVSQCEDASRAVVPDEVCDDSTDSNPAAPKLTVEKSQSPEQPQIGSTLTYRVKVKNAADGDPAQRVELTDQLPAGVEIVRTEAPAGTTVTPDASGKLVWKVGAVDPGTERVLTVVVKVRQDASTTATLVNKAWTSAGPDGSVPTANQCGGEPTKACSGEGAQPPVKPSITMTKSVDPKDPQIGETVTYTVTMKNTSAVAAKDLEVRDDLPEGLTLVGAPTASNGTATAADPIVWKVPALAGGAGATLTYRARVGDGAKGKKLRNVADLTEGPTPTVPDENQCADAAGQPISGKVCDDGAGGEPKDPKLILSKLQRPGTPQVGSTLTYVLELRNEGDDDARRSEILDRLPVGVDLVSAVPSVSTDAVDVSGAPLIRWKPDTVSAKGSKQLTVTVKVRQDVSLDDELTNRAYSTAGPAATPLAGNACSDNAMHACAGNKVPASPSLRAKKTVTPKDPQVGEEVVYVITVENTGDSPAADLKIDDVLPAGVRLDKADATEGSVTGTGPVVWDIPALDARTTATLTLTGTVTDAAKGRKLKNIAKVTEGPNPTVDPESICKDANGQPIPGQICDDGDGTEPKDPELTLTKTQSPAQPQVGNTLVYTVRIANAAGADAARRVEVTDLLPAGVEVVDVDPSVGTVDRASAPKLTWAVGTLAAGADATAKITVKVKQDASTTDKLINKAWTTDGAKAAVPADNQCDGEADKACSGESSQPPAKPQWTLSKTASPTDPQVGEVVTYTLKAANTGTVDAKDLEVRDDVPTGLTLLTVDAPAGTTAPKADPVVWRIPTLAAGETKELKLFAEVTDGAKGRKLRNSAEVTEGPDPLVPDENTCKDDPTPGKVCDTDGDGTDVGEPRLTLTKTQTPAQPQVGNTLTYTVRIANAAGADPAKRVRITDLLPDDVDLVRTAASAGAVDETGKPALDWNVGELAAGTDATLTITVKVKQTASTTEKLINKAWTTTGARPEVPTANQCPGEATKACSGDKADPPAKPEWTVTKTASPTDPQVGETVVYTLTAKNTGTVVAKDLEIQDELPRGLTLVGTPDASEGSATAADPVVWRIPVLNANTTATLKITAKVTAAALGTKLRNAAEVTEGPDPTVPDGNRCKDDPDPAKICDTDGDGTDVTEPKLTLTKTQVPAQPQVGNTLTYAVKIVNAAGAAQAKRVQITDLLPTGVDLVSAVSSDTGDPVDTAAKPRLVWNIGDVAAGDERTLTVTVKVRQDASAKVVNRAWTSTGPQPEIPEPNRCDDNAEQACAGEDAELPGRPDWTLSKTADPAQPQIGEVVTYTLKAVNNGTVEGRDLEIEDKLPEGLALLDVRASDGTSAERTDPVVWKIPTLAANATETLTITAKVTQGARGKKLKNQADVTEGPNPVIPPDNQCKDDPTKVCDTDGDGTEPKEPRLTLTKTQLPAQSQVGSTLTYTVKLANAAGADGAKRAEVTDLLPAGVDLVKAESSAGTVDASGKPTLTWTIGDLAAGADATMTVTVKVRQDASTADKLVNQTWTSAGAEGSVPAANQCAGEPAKACSGDRTDPPAKPTWTVSKTADPADPQVGETVTYTLKAVNTGAVPGRDLEIRDDVPAGLTLLDVRPSTGTTAAKADPVVWRIPTLAAGTTEELKIVAKVTEAAKGRKLRNMAEVTEGPDPKVPDENTCKDDPDPAKVCDTDGDGTDVKEPRLTLTKTQLPSDPQIGTTLTYTVKIANAAGADTAKRSEVTDLLPAGVDLVKAESSAGTVDASGKPTLTWTVGDLAAGADATMTVTVKVRQDADTTKKIVNKTWTTAGSEAEVPTDNQCAGEPTKACSGENAKEPGKPQWTLSKTADPKDPQVGEKVTYTLKAVNTGATEAKDLEIKDDVPNGLTLLDVRPSAGTRAEKTDPIVWKIPALAGGETKELKFTALVTAGAKGTKLKNSAEVTEGPDPKVPDENTCKDDPTPGKVCDTDGDGTDVGEPRLTLTKKQSLTAPQVGVPFTYTVKIANAAGADKAERITITDALPEGVEVVKAAPTAGTVASETARPLVWTVGTLAAGADAELVLTVKATSAANKSEKLVNKAWTSTGAEATVPTDNQCPDDATKACASGTQPPVDPKLVISKKVAPTPLLPGATATYTITVKNDADAPYPDAEFSDSLAGVLDDADWVGVTEEAGGKAVFTAPDLKWTGDFAPHESKRITYQVKIPTQPKPGGDQELRNKVVSELPGSNCPFGSTDPECGIDTDGSGVPYVTLAKSADKATALPGETVTYTLTLTNAGAGTYRGYSLTDDLTKVLDDASYEGDVQATTGTATVSGTQLTWTGDVPGKGTATLTYSVRIPDPARAGASADRKLVNAVSSTEAGSNCRTAQAGCTTTVTYPNLHFRKEMAPAKPLPGTKVTYTVTVVNDGEGTYPAAAFEDDLTKVLGDADYNADATASAGSATYDAAAKKLTWKGDVPAGTPVTVTYSVTVHERPKPGATGRLLNGIVSSNPGSNCKAGAANAECGNTFGGLSPDEEGGFPQLDVKKSADHVHAVPGSEVTYTILITNDGGAAYENVTVTDDLSAVLTDADYNDDAASDKGGKLTYTAPVLTWTGDVPARGKVKVTYSVKVPTRTKPTATALLKNTALSADAGSNCKPTTPGAECGVEVPIANPALTKTVDKRNPLPGDKVTYTVKVFNTGRADFPNADFTDDLTDVLDDARWNDDLTVTPGNPAPVFDPATGKLTWTGPVRHGGDATAVVITYSVTVGAPPQGNAKLTNSLTSTDPGSNCVEGEQTEECGTGHGEDGGIPKLYVNLVDDHVVAKPGERVQYTARVKNTGTAPYPAAKAYVDLAEVMDSATVADDVRTDKGTAARIPRAQLPAELRDRAIPSPRDVVSWTGDLPVGETATITWSAVIDTPPGGNRHLNAHIIGHASNCSRRQGVETECADEVLIPFVTYAKKVTGPATPKPGDRLTYTVSMKNTGTGVYEGAAFADDLREILDDVRFTPSAVTSSLGKVTYSAPVLSWKGDIPAGAAATVSYPVTVVGARTGDGRLTNTLDSTATLGSNCPRSTRDASCSTSTKITQLPIKPIKPVKPVHPKPGPLPHDPHPLPDTGTDGWRTAAAAGAGALLLAVGGALIVITRRRRNSSS